MFCNDKGELIDVVYEITPEVMSWAKGPADENVSKGGMIAKLEAVKIAHDAGIDVYACTVDCFIKNIKKIMNREIVPTYFPAPKRVTGFSQYA